MVYAYRADGTAVSGNPPRGPGNHPDASTLLAPARLLFGELMVPVYDFRAKGKGHWHPWQGDWDPTPRILTLNTYYPDGVASHPPRRERRPHMRPFSYCSWRSSPRLPSLPLGNRSAAGDAGHIGAYDSWSVLFPGHQLLAPPGGNHPYLGTKGLSAGSKN